MGRLTTSNQDTFDLNATCKRSGIQKIAMLDKKLKQYKELRYEPEQLQMMIKELDKCMLLEKDRKILNLLSKVGDKVYVDYKDIIKRPVPDMSPKVEIEEPKKYLTGEIVSVRKDRNRWYLKIAIRENWYEEWIDMECGHDSGYREHIKYFTYRASQIGKTIFLLREEAEKNLDFKIDRI